MTAPISAANPSNPARRATRTIVLLGCLFATLMAWALGRAPEAAMAAGKPNIVVLQTDDQTAATLHATFVNRHGKRRPVMPNTLKLVVGQGVEFKDYYVSDPVCSPSRAALLSGQYGHTSGLVRNSGNRGGARGLTRSPVFTAGLPTALNRAGYHTAHFGRLTNNYGDPDGYSDPEPPKGWDTWVTDWGSQGVRRYYGYYLNVNGKIRGPYGKAHYRKFRNKDPRSCPHAKVRCNYHTDLITKKAIRDIKSVKKGPFYVQIDYEAPHDGATSGADAEPPSRYIGTARRTPFLKPPGFNERDISDKPKLIRRTAKRLTPREFKGLKKRYRKQLEALRGVDDSVGRIIRTLKRQNELGNTYIFFQSDNGYFLGEHRYSKSKFLAYEPSVRVPMAVRGPIAKKGEVSNAIVSNVDLAATITNLAHTDPQLASDGRSFKPLLRKPRRVGHRAVLLESYLYPSDPLDAHLDQTRPFVTGAQSGGSASASGATASSSAPPLNYSAIRAGRYKYIEYADGGRELYDLKVDPYELRNKVHTSRYRKVYKYLEDQLAKRRFCDGAACRRGVKHIPYVKPKKKHHKNKKHHKGHEGQSGGATS